jgi:hypothetical protein
VEVLWDQGGLNHNASGEMQRKYAQTAAEDSACVRIKESSFLLSDFQVARDIFEMCLAHFLLA